jgi:hypothetical protein
MGILLLEAKDGVFISSMSMRNTRVRRRDIWILVQEASDVRYTSKELQEVALRSRCMSIVRLSLLVNRVGKRDEGWDILTKVLKVRESRHRGILSTLSRGRRSSRQPRSLQRRPEIFSAEGKVSCDDDDGASRKQAIQKVRPDGVRVG